MSAGNFETTKYQATYNVTQIHRIKIQPETRQAVMDNAPNPDIVNNPPGADVNNPITALSSLNRKSRGLRPRHVVCSWVSGRPSGYADDSIVRIVCLTETFYNAATVGRQINYLGGIVRVEEKEPERAR